MINTSRILSLIVTLIALLATQASATESRLDHSGKRYKITPVTSVEDGVLGGKRIYFRLACNQQYISVLSEPKSENEVDIAVLTLVSDVQCDQPNRTVFQRVTMGEKTLNPVDSFEHVWRCSGLCFSYGDPSTVYEHVTKYGTSEAQTRSRLPCPAQEQVDMVCFEIEASN